MGKAVYSFMMMRDKDIENTVVRSTTIPEELGGYLSPTPSWCLLVVVSIAKEGAFCYTKLH